MAQRAVEKKVEMLLQGKKTSSWEKSDLYGVYLWDMAKSTEQSHFRVRHTVRQAEGCQSMHEHPFFLVLLPPDHPPARGRLPGSAKPNHREMLDEPTGQGQSWRRDVVPGTDQTPPHLPCEPQTTRPAGGVTEAASD